MNTVVRAAALAALFMSTSFEIALAAPPHDAASEVAAKAKAFLEAARSRNCGKVQELGPAFLEHPDNLSETIVASSYELLASCELNDNKTGSALDHLTRGTQFQSASDNAWVLRFNVEIYLKKYDTAVSTLETIAQNRKSAVSQLDMMELTFLNRDLTTLGEKPLQARFLKTVIAPDFAPANPFWSADYYIFELAAIESDTGQKDEASALIARIDSPGIVIRAGLDPRFRTIATKATDVRAVLERKLANDQRISKLHPDWLQGYVQQARDLRGLGRDEEALKILDSARNRAGVLREFVDQSDQLSWYWNERAYVYAGIGAKDDAVASMRRGGVNLESGQLNVSQVINLALMQNDLGLGNDALETLNIFSASKRMMSPYGEIEMRLARVCAYSLVNQLAKTADDVDYAKLREADNPGAAAILLSCAGDKDAAAAILIHMLDDPDKRPMLLEELSTFATLGSKRQSFSDSHLSDLAKRPDLAAAVQRAGGSREFNIRSDY